MRGPVPKGALWKMENEISKMLEDVNLSKESSEELIRKVMSYAFEVMYFNTWNQKKEPKYMAKYTLTNGIVNILNEDNEFNPFINKTNQEDNFEEFRIIL